MHYSILILLLLIQSCASTPPTVHPVRPVIDQISSPFPGKKGLVHRVCKSFNEFRECDNWHWDSYDLSDPIVRRDLRRLKFVCKVNDKYYHPCKDENALCRNHKCSRGFLGLGKRKCKKSKLSMVGDYAFLIKAQTYCFSMNRYSP